MTSSTEQDTKNVCVSRVCDVGDDEIEMTRGSTYPQHFHFMRIFTRLIHFQFTQKPITVTLRAHVAKRAKGAFPDERKQYNNNRFGDVIVFISLESTDRDRRAGARMRCANKISPNMSVFRSYSESALHVDRRRHVDIEAKRRKSLKYTRTV